MVELQWYHWFFAISAGIGVGMPGIVMLITMIVPSWRKVAASEGGKP